jgi:RimJ/RimL family protein N-acetyltransferase
MNFQIIYRDESLEIRPLAVSEAPALFEAVKSSLADIGQWESWCVNTFALSDALTFLEGVEKNWASDSAYDCNVIERKTGLVVGSVSVNQMNRQNNLGNIGYWTRTSHVKRGIASFAVKAVSSFAFKDLGLTRLEIVAQDRNIGSQRVAEKAGARFECLARNRLVFRGEPRDARIFSILPEDVHD